MRRLQNSRRSCEGRNLGEVNSNRQLCIPAISPSPQPSPSREREFCNRPNYGRRYDGKVVIAWISQVRRQPLRQGAGAEQAVNSEGQRRWTNVGVSGKTTNRHKGENLNHKPKENHSCPMNTHITAPRHFRLYGAYWPWPPCCRLTQISTTTPSPAPRKQTRTPIRLGSSATATTPSSTASGTTKSATWPTTSAPKGYGDGLGGITITRTDASQNLTFSTKLHSD